MDRITQLEKLLATGKDHALLRFSLASAYLEQDQAEIAARHLACAVTLDPNYSAAWKLYGKSLMMLGHHNQARAIYTQGISVANARGDIQAAKEMTVFLKRLDKPTNDDKATAVE
jgi:Tfp pilus assembly protein PilF